MPLSQFLIVILNEFLIMIAFCTIYNFIAMLFSEITISTTICILIFIAMYITSSSLSLVISNKPYVDNIYFGENGEGHIISQTINPNYPGEQKIKIAKTIYYFMPQGQAEEIQNGKTEYLSKLPFYSITLIGMVNLVGIYLFTKKELK